MMLSTLYRYQSWADDAFFDKLEALRDTGQEADYIEAVRLMNHSHVVAEIFAAHLTGRAHGYAADNTEATPPMAELRAAMAKSDRWYLDYAGQVSAEQLAETIAFTFTDGDKGCMSREEMLFHVVLHGGYHRGEVGRILKRHGLETPWDTFAVFLHRTQPDRRLQGAA